MRLALLYDRIRVEEKLLVQELDRRGVAYDLVDVRRATFDLARKTTVERYDVVLDRCVGQTISLAALRILGSWGLPCVNRAEVVATCGDKLSTTLALERAGIATPRVMVAFSPEAALDAIEVLGYPVVLKPTVGSWGRLVSRVNDRDAAEAVLEHKAVLGSTLHDVIYIQEFIDKPGHDIRTFVVGDETICAIRRESAHWITNTARGGRASNQVVTPAIDSLSQAAARAVGGGVVAIDLLETRDGRLMVNEVNHTMEFRNSIAPTGVNIPGRIVEFALAAARAGSPLAEPVPA